MTGPSICGHPSAGHLPFRATQSFAGYDRLRRDLVLGASARPSHFDTTAVAMLLPITFVAERPMSRK